jgi:hypothetical protein
MMAGGVASIPTTKPEWTMAGENVTEKKRPGRVTIPPEDKFLVGRVEAADMLSISRRALDYLVANKLLTARNPECEYRRQRRRISLLT